VQPGVTSQAVSVTPDTTYQVSSTEPAGYAVYWGICSGACSWTPGSSVTVNAPTSGSLEIRFLYRHYTTKISPYLASYYRYTGYTKWFIYSSCVDQIAEINVQSLDYPSDLPVAQIARASRDQVRNSPDGWGKCVTPVGASYATTSCPNLVGSNHTGVLATIRIFDDPSFADPSWFNAVGSYPYPDACEQIEGGGGAQVCHEHPFPRNVTPTVPVPISVAPALASGGGICSNMFVQCNDLCGNLDFGYVVNDPGRAAWCNSNCNPPGPETEHWKHVYADERLTAVSGLVGGGKWNDKVCANGVLCKPGATCRFPEIANDDFGPQHLDRDFNFSIIPIRNGAIDGSSLNPVDLYRLAGGGFPTLDAEIEYHYFYPRQGPGHFAGDALPDVLLETPHYSISVKNQATPGPLFNGVPEGPSFRSPVLSTLGDSWSIDMPTAGDQITTKGVLIWDCGHMEPDGTAYGRGFHTELHPVVATAWLHLPMPGDPLPQSRFSKLFVKALSHAPYPSGTYRPFDGLSGTFTIPDYDPALPLCISDAIVDHNAVAQYASSWNRYGDFLGLVNYPTKEPYGYIVAGPDLIIPGTTNPKYWDLSVSHLGGGHLQLTLAGNFPGGSDYNITEGTVYPDYPLMMGTHFELCQLATDSSGNVVSNCLGKCQVPPSGTCPFGTGATSGNCVAIVAPTRLVATPLGNQTNAVTVSWSPVAGATGYRLYWGYGASGGALSAFPGPITSTAISDTRDWGSTFHYVVTAVNGAFESASSNVAAMTMYPAAPTGVTATGGIGQVTVSWAASNGATRYQVYRVDGASYVLGATTTGTSQVFTGLASQTTYSYAVDAWNATGGSIRSAIASATTSYQCNPITCPTGCCSSNSCMPGNQPAYGCASGGSACNASCFGGPSNAYCGGGVCGCAPTTCSSLGWNCDPMNNGCGNVVSCGTCSSPQTCGGGGMAHVCGCAPQTCGTRCGTVSDGCGGLLDCPPCPPPPGCTTCVIN
jgi:hypothetical protein